METINTDIAREEVSSLNEEKQTHFKKLKQKRVRITLSLLGLSIFFFLTTIYSQYQVHVEKKLAEAYDLSHPEVPSTPDQIIEALSKHILLPDTIPQIATVQDAKKLSTSQTFFKNASNGDVVVVYDIMIILYRPSQNLVIAVGDLSAK